MPSFPALLVVATLIAWIATVGSIAYQHRDLDRPRRKG
jgi:hypothetical protein